MKLSASSEQRIASGLESAEEINGIIDEGQKALQQLPEIDQVRIAELKQAIANGSIPLDVDTLARNMLDYFRNRG
ncbi:MULTISPECIES: flagellar biosynthesis anti-sigma factor FlgM [Winslowiella]|uniref:flagellar biosynthesis anti-sigma factor FlgM n=1 Tax=Winslowiella TaxID=2997349 RepID=UPI0028BDD100|nr:flagellar biosynthesis anti-sigma factor FlgM [Winslowiella toletana]WNN43700.1 flagellar biosynthesis anti-sigma factor FlgM [Winslowiella toletana]